MKPLFFVTAVMICGFHLSAQQFKHVHSISLADSITEIDAEWVDLDNDGLLDNILYVINDENEMYLQFVKGDTVNPPKVHEKGYRLPDYSSRHVVDYDQDNQIDIVLSTSDNVYLLKNLGELNFLQIELGIPPFSLIRFADVNNDGHSECVVSGHHNANKFTSTLTSENGSDWVVATDSLHVELNEFQTLDFNEDGLNDIFLSGRVGSDSVFTALLINDGKHFKWHGTVDLLTEKCILVDLDADGFMDLVFHGKDSNGQNLRYTVKNQHGIPSYQRSAQDGDIRSLDLCDLDSDGLIDEALLYRMSRGQTNRITYSDNTSEMLPAENVQAQIFGDMEHDGDLDILQVVKTSGITLDLLINTPKQVNRHPAAPAHGIAIPVYDNLFMYWEKALDDHTSREVITYDVHLETSQPLLSGNFDLLNENRLTVSHGNNGLVNFKLIKNFTNKNYNYLIQSVDNSFHGGGGICMGGPGCAEITEQPVTMCSSEVTSLIANGNSLWFSLSKGYLGEGGSLEYNASARDTIFSFQPNFPGCAKLTTYLITIQNDTVKRISDSITGCEGTEISLSREGKNLQWKSDVYGNLGDGATIDYLLRANDKVTSTFRNAEGCTIVHETTVTLSRPVISVDPSEVIIPKGGSVQLEASGAESYQWEPAEGLSNPGASNPVASPLVDTRYTVTAQDSIGCSAKATAFIRVESSGYIPTLFTPNEDGRNDELRVYGLADVKAFSLTVSNRNGTTVFKTKKLEEALHQGWDGSTNGVKQPNGVYFWKVEGVLGSGEKLLLNGRGEGSFLLLR